MPYIVKTELQNDMRYPSFAVILLWRTGANDDIRLIHRIAASSTSHSTAPTRT